LEVSICERVIEEVVLAHRDVIVRDGITRRGTIGELVPFEAALERLRAGRHVPDVLATDPNSFSTFRNSLFETMSALADAPNPMSVLEEFRARWKLSEAQLIDILLPYREYDKRFSPALRRIFSDADAQDLSTWARYRIYMDDSPRLRARYDFYLSHIGQLSVPQMVTELRKVDPNIHEGRVRDEIGALHLQIQASFDRPVSPDELRALNQRLVQNKHKPYPGENPSYLDALAFAVNEGESVDDAARSLNLGGPAAQFFLHFKGVETRSVLWDRVVTDAQGTRSSEEDLLRRLHAAGFHYHQIASMLNAAYGKSGGHTPLPDEPDFRTLPSVANKIIALGLARQNKSGLPDLVDPIFGTVKIDGELVMPEALDLIRARRAAGDSFFEIAKRLHVAESTTRRFESLHSPDFDVSLPSPLRRLVKDLPEAAPRLVKPEKAPERGVSENFDAFHDSYRKGAEDWETTTPATFLHEQALIQKHLGLTKEQWQESVIANLSVYNGGVARQDESRTSRPLKVIEIRNVRYRFYQMFKNAIKIYNSKYPDGPVLNEAMLKTSEGIKLVIETLRGGKIGAPYAVGRDPIFDSFYDHFRVGTEACSLSSGKAWKEEISRIRKNLNMEELEDIKRASRITARLDETKHADDRDRLGTIRAARFEVYNFLIKGIERFNNKFPDAKPLSAQMLDSSEGIKEVLEALRGEKFPRIERPKEINEEAYASGKNPAFDQFYDAFRDGVEDWPISGAENWLEEVNKIKRHLKMTDDEWTQKFGDILGSWGGTAKRTESKNILTSSIRTARLRVYLLFEGAIEEHNRRYPEAPRLDPEQLRTAGGIKGVIEILVNPP
jgi:hypothetical protein